MSLEVRTSSAAGFETLRLVSALSLRSPRACSAARSNTSDVSPKKRSSIGLSPNSSTRSHCGPSAARGAFGVLGVEADAWRTRRRIWWITFSLWRPSASGCFRRRLRYKMAYDSRLMSDVLNVVARAVLSHLRPRARKFMGLRDSQSGAVTFIQRFGDALNCNVHFH